MNDFCRLSVLALLMLLLVSGCGGGDSPALNVSVDNLSLSESSESVAPAKPLVWYEDNNLGSALLQMDDYVTKFETPEEFTDATSGLDVYQFRTAQLATVSDSDLANLIAPYIRDNNLHLALDTGAATWAQYGARHQLLTQDEALVVKLVDLGIAPSFISLQSVISKDLKVDGEVVPYPMSQRIEDIVNYVSVISSIAPDVRFGLIDALPTQGKEYKDAYLEVASALRGAGYQLDYIHLDAPFEYQINHSNGMCWSCINEIGSYVTDVVGASFGLIMTSVEGGRTSSQDFHEKTLKSMECYLVAGGQANDISLMSWFPYPNKAIPDYATGSEYTYMRTLKEFNYLLDDILIDFPAWRAQKLSEEGWLESCGGI